MSLGYAVYEDNRDFEQDGITGSVKRYTTAKMKFPCYVINSTPDNQVQGFRIEVLRKMFETVKVYSAEDAASVIHLYFTDGERVAELGQIQPKQVKSFLKLFEDNIIDGYYDKDTEISGMYLYVLAE